MMHDKSNTCDPVRDDLAPLVDRDPEDLRAHADHLASCDACRDLKHEAAQAAERVADAGADFVFPVDMATRVLAAIDAEVDSAPRAIPEVPTPAPRAEAASKVREVAEAKSKTTAPKGDAAAPAAGHATTRTRWIWGVGALAAAAAVGGVVALGSGLLSTDVPGTAPIALPGTTAPSGQLAKVSRASTDGASGVELRAPGASSFAPIAIGASLPPGSVLRTDARTRARVNLSDGTVLVLDQGTELSLDASVPRLVHLASGEIVADVAHLASGPAAVFETPTGRVEVLGTKFALSATQDLASVRVTRGLVRVHGASGGTADVPAGQEGMMPKAGTVRVAPVANLASTTAWSELGLQGETVEAGPAGLGELRARRPGEREDRERPLTLARHKVSIRIAGNVARTEIEEVFRNDGNDTLEGVYRFPLPPHGQIARLALDVDGRMEEGAFVDRTRAAKIWAGVIRAATPVQIRKPEDEFIWVPGPWRDPALLEWKRGGRFELRIFPIPAHGERRVSLAYTETLAPMRDGRRYVYPLPRSGDASTRVGRFEADVRVAGADLSAPVVAHGYEMRSNREGDAMRMAFAQDQFLPTGDIVIDYALPNRDAELRAWTYVGTAAPQAVTGARPAARRAPGADEAVDTAVREVSGDTRPFVAFAIRPELPGFTQSTPHDYVLVVDASQSMVGERYARAKRLASGIVAEMDRRDRFVVLACDATCRIMSDALASPSSVAASQVEAWLGSIRPAGASDVVGALSAAARALEGKRAEGRSVQILYLGDGVASTGHRRVASLAAEAESLARTARVSVTTVGIGGDADAMALAAIARSGGGQYVPYVPGERASTTALSVLETSYGVSLTNAALELPPGIVDVAPAKLPTIRAGQEVIVVGRLASPEVQGEVVLRGSVAGQPYVDRYPVSLRPSSAEGNAFVPQLWAAGMIERLELEGRGEDRARIVAVSQVHGVLSRHTSLLVLESEAMFRAFGVSRNHPVAQWTGEGQAEVSEANGTEAQAAGTRAGNLDSLASLATGEVGGLGFAGADRGGGGAAPMGGSMRRARSEADMDDAAGADENEESRSAEREAPADEPAADARGDRFAAGPMPAPPPQLSQPAPVAANQAPAVGATSTRATAPAKRPAGRAARPVGPGRWMRRVWIRVGQVQGFGGTTAAESQAVAEREAALRAQPESRDRHRDLLRALARSGQMARALEIAEKWMGKDPLDTEALTSLADVLGRSGQRDEALRFLSGVVDLDPDSKALQERLAKAFERAGDADRACSHRIALAEISANDPAAIGAAVRCERARARFDGAQRLLSAAATSEIRARADVAAGSVAPVSSANGDIVADASWSGMADLDLSIVTPQGTRISWMGGRTGVEAQAVRDTSRERLALRRATVGSYVIEVNRTRPGDTTPVVGRVALSVLGQRRTFDFTMQGDHVAVGRAVVRRESRTETVFQ
jgi:tetratricopeptide (TPR) repeat protein